MADSNGTRGIGGWVDPQLCCCAAVCVCLRAGGGVVYRALLCRCIRSPNQEPSAAAAAAAAAASSASSVPSSPSLAPLALLSSSAASLPHAPISVLPLADSSMCNERIVMCTPSPYGSGSGSGSDGPNDGESHARIRGHSASCARILLKSGGSERVRHLHMDKLRSAKSERDRHRAQTATRWIDDPSSCSLCSVDRLCL